MVIVLSFAQFLPYVFIICVVGMIFDLFIKGFRGHL